MSPTTGPWNAHPASGLGLDLEHAVREFDLPDSLQGVRNAASCAIASGGPATSVRVTCPNEKEPSVRTRSARSSTASLRAGEAAGKTAHHEGMEDMKDVNHQGVAKEVGLALRGHRRQLGQSQRAYAAQRGMNRAQLARMELDASGVPLGAVADVLEGTGYCLAVIPVGTAPVIDWDPTDLEARTRAGARFPANRTVQRSTFGPYWWWYHEMMGTGACGAKPVWTAEGFHPGPETRFGPEPRGGRSW